MSRLNKVMRLLHRDTVVVESGRKVLHCQGVFPVLGRLLVVLVLIVVITATAAASSTATTSRRGGVVGAGLAVLQSVVGNVRDEFLGGH